MVKYKLPEKNSEKIKVITKLYSDLKVDIDCKKIMTKYKQKAISNLKEMEISGGKTTLLQNVAEFLMTGTNNIFAINSNKF